MPKKRFRLFGVERQTWIRLFFQSNSTLAIAVLFLIMLFLLKEGVGFFPQHLENLKIYRLAGLEFVANINEQIDAHTALKRLLAEIRLEQFRHLTEVEKKSAGQVQTELAEFDAAASQFKKSVYPLRALASKLGDAASQLKDRHVIAAHQKEHVRALIAAGEREKAAEIHPETISFERETAIFNEAIPHYKEVTASFKKELLIALRALPEGLTEHSRQSLKHFHSLTLNYVETFPATAHRLEVWRYDAKVPALRAVSAFLFGREWVTNSYWQDFYGVLPLLTGSFLIASLAIAISVPFGIGAAVFVNQIASRREREIIKPAIEFIQAIPSVVLGFFGIVVLGETIRALSQSEYLSWIPFFPIQERLNIFTAGLLLALLAVPTIFTLAEDAINNVPTSFIQASYALGATRMQTILRVIVPTALSGIIAAVLLGFGRVIGETMVVLLVAGNRIAIPDFTAGLGVLFQPAHTMTGIIAQEMGEVVPGSLHYRALFIVGIFLFLISLALNYAARSATKKFALSQGHL